MTSLQRQRRHGVLDLNGSRHRPALIIFGVIVLGHWAEHLVQAYQIWGLGWTRADSRGVLGMPFPWLIQQEWLHYGYAVVMLAGLWILLPGFTGRARTWWIVALAIQFWHHIEHLLLLVQALTGQHLLGRPVPTSIAQVFFARVELHLFYNAVVFLPMIIALYLHMRPTPAEAAAAGCACGNRVLAAAP